MRNHTFILHQEEANPRSVFSLLQLHSNDNVSAKQQPEVVAFTQSQSCGAELINSAAEKILHSEALTWSMHLRDQQHQVLTDCKTCSVSLNTAQSIKSSASTARHPNAIPARSKVGEDSASFKPRRNCHTGMRIT